MYLEDCKNGHFMCSDKRGGPCENERAARAATCEHEEHWDGWTYSHPFDGEGDALIDSITATKVS